MLFSALFTLLFLSRAQAADELSEDDFFQFVTRPDIGAPKWHIEMYDRDAVQTGMYWFVSPYASLDQVDFPLWNGPHIYDGEGGLIWSGAPYVNYINIFDFRMSIVDGRQMISFIWPKHKPEGNGFILDESYEVYTVVDMVGNQTAWNMHEFNLINDGKTALMAVKQDYSATRVDIDEYTGPCKIGWQGFKEVDVKSGEILFEWNTQHHVDVRESSYVAKNTKNTWEDKCAKEWDITHVNAVDKFPDGDYLFSARHTDTLYKVSHVDRSIVWRLGGMSSDFELKDQRAKFSRQHHARVFGQNETHTLVSLFDNAAGSGSVEDYSSSASWGLLIALRTDTTPMTADIVARYEKPLIDDEHDYSKSRGSVSFLPNGNAFVGWVTGSHIAEYTADGRLVMTAILPRNEASSYRSYKFPWVGRPAQPPDVVANAVQRRAGNADLSTVVHVSWNGATEVATWNLLHTNVHGNISQLAASSPRQGFETRLSIDGFAKHIITVALDRTGQEIGRSKVVTVVLPPDLQSPAIAHEESEWIKNHSTSQWMPSVLTEGGSVSLGKLEWFIIGFVCCVVVCCAGIALWLRRRARQHGASWFSRYRQTTYNSVAESDEDEMAQREWMLDEKEDGIEDDDSEEMSHTRTSSRPRQ